MKHREASRTWSRMTSTWAYENEEKNKILIRRMKMHMRALICTARTSSLENPCFHSQKPETEYALECKPIGYAKKMSKATMLFCKPVSNENATCITCFTMNRFDSICWLRRWSSSGSLLEELSRYFEILQRRWFYALADDPMQMLERRLLIALVWWWLFDLKVIIR